MSQLLQGPLKKTISSGSSPAPPVTYSPEVQPVESISLPSNIIPEDMEIDGDIKCLGNLTVEGNITGEAECGGHLVIGANANITKGFKAASVMICGEVDCRWSQMKDGKPPC